MVQPVCRNEKRRLAHMTLQQEYMERYEEGLIKGEERGCVNGKTDGRLEGKIEILSTELHMTPSQIADKLSLSEFEVLRVLAELQE